MYCCFYDMQKRKPIFVVCSYLVFRSLRKEMSLTQVITCLKNMHNRNEIKRKETFKVCNFIDVSQMDF